MYSTVCSSNDLQPGCCRFAIASQIQLVLNHVGNVSLIAEDLTSTGDENICKAPSTRIRFHRKRYRFQ